MFTFDTTNRDMVSRALGSGGTSSGKTITPDNAMAISAAWGCMRIISEALGTVPWAIYERKGKDNAEKVPDHPLSKVLVDSPNADMTSAEYRETLALNLCQNGNTYSMIERAGNKIISLYPMKSGDVTPKRDKTGKVYYEWSKDGQQLELPRDKVWHVRLFSNDGLVGLSPIGAAREALGTSLAAEDFAARFFSQGGMPGGTVTMPEWLTDEQRAQAQGKLNAVMTGLGNAHTFALFEGGMKPEPWTGMPLKDMEFLLLRKFSILEIARFYRIPPHMIQDLDKATFSNIEHLAGEFVTFTLMPYFTKIESSVSKWLLAPNERSKFFLRFNFEGLLRADSAGRASFYTVMVDKGIMTRNQVRALENLNKSTSDGMDAYTVQSQMVSIEDVVKEEKEEPVAPPAFGAPPALNAALPPPAPGTGVVPAPPAADPVKSIEMKIAEGIVRVRRDGDWAQRELVELFEKGMVALRAEVSITEKERHKREERQHKEFLAMLAALQGGTQQLVLQLPEDGKLFDVHVENPVNIAEGAVQIVQTKAPVRRIPIRDETGRIQHIDELDMPVPPLKNEDDDDGEGGAAAAA